MLRREQPRDVNQAFGTDVQYGDSAVGLRPENGNALHRVGPGIDQTILCTQYNSEKNSALIRIFEVNIILK
jgi:hypothetical protein